LPPTDDIHPSTPPEHEVPNVEDHEDTYERGVLGSDACPEGNKAAKRKRAEDQVLEKVLKTQEELVRISKERMNSVKAAMQAASDEHIMAMDLSGMDEETKSYWQKKRRAILDRPE